MATVPTLNRPEAEEVIYDRQSHHAEVGSQLRAAQIPKQVLMLHHQVTNKPPTKLHMSLRQTILHIQVPDLSLDAEGGKVRIALISKMYKALLRKGEWVEGRLGMALHL